MKIIVLILSVFFIATMCSAAQLIEVKTEHGYFTDSEGNVIAKAELPKGFHPMKDGQKYVEVKDKKALDKIEIYVAPDTQKQKDEKVVKQYMRKLAIEKAKVDGKLPQDYE